MNAIAFVRGLGLMNMLTILVIASSTGHGSNTAGLYRHVWNYILF